jgi:hypothetical protein
VAGKRGLKEEEEFLKEAESALGGVLPAEYSPHLRDLCRGTVRGGDLRSFATPREWAEWLSCCTVLLDEKDYLSATVHALERAPGYAATDYGTARRRDLGQRWTDAIRGFLGEIAFAKWLRQRWGRSAELDYSAGPLQQFLLTDIKEVNGRRPKLSLSIKATKLGGIWLDIPGAQIEHSDIFVLVRVGTTPEHFVAFLKKISAIGDKILRRALDLKVISEEDFKRIWEAVPEFSTVPAYIAGFFDKREHQPKLEDRSAVLCVGGRMGRKVFKITEFMGFWNPKENAYLEKVLQILREQRRPVPEGAKVEFEGIDEFSRELHFIVSSGLLRRRLEEWQKVLAEL